MIEALKEKVALQEEEIAYLKRVIKRLQENDIPSYEESKAISVRDDIIDNLSKENKKLKDKLFSGLDLPTYKEWSKQGPKALSLYLDAMAAIYARECNINPMKVKLKVCVPENGKSIEYLFTEITGNERVVEIHDPV